MRDINKIVKIAITSLITATSLNAIAHAVTPDNDTTEKCYGIVKAAMNDCSTATQSCAGSATKDKQADAFIFLPKGACTKIVGGNLQKSTENKTKE